MTFGITVALGFVLLPADSVAYWGGKFATPGDGPERLVNQSIDGLVQRAMHVGTGALVVWLVLAALTFTGGLVTAAVASQRGWELLGIVVCAVTGLLISPISWTHHWVYVIPGLALLASRAPQSPERDRATAGHLAGSSAVAGAGRMAAGAVVVGLFAMWPARSGPNGSYDPKAALVPRGLLRFALHNFGREYRWRGLELLLGNYYVLMAAIFVIVTAGYLALTRDQA